MAAVFSFHPYPPTAPHSPCKTNKNFSSSTNPSLNSKRPPPSINCFRPPESDPPPAVQTFWQWLSDERVVSAKFPARPGLVPEGLGLIAQRDIARNEVVLEVPNRFWINPDTVAASEIGSVCSGLKPWVSVALFLIREKKLRDGSKWKIYLDILPEYTNSTIFWWVLVLLIIDIGNGYDECLLVLFSAGQKRSSLSFKVCIFVFDVVFAGTQLLRTTLGVKELVQNEFHKAEEVILSHQQLFPSPVTLDDFVWAFGILRSRAFSRLSGQTLVLVPLADLINHSPNITREDYAWEIKGAGLFSRDLLFSLRSPVPVKAGEQVLIQYDLNKSNAELALDYGFTESRSERSVYTLTLEIPESDPFFGEKLDIAESNGLGETAYFDITLGQPTLLPPTMLPYLRLIALGGTDAFLLESLFMNSIWGHLELPVSRANEELICQAMLTACKSALSGYNTTVKEDEKSFEERNRLDPRLEIAVNIRLGEKKVLQQIDEIFRGMETELDGLEYYQERRLRQLGLVGEEGQLIFWESK
ncbi:hypothetical protein Dimus_014885 [Dionaea muscipula]